MFYLFELSGQYHTPRRLSSNLFSRPKIRPKMADLKHTCLLRMTQDQRLWTGVGIIIDQYFS